VLLRQAVGLRWRRTLGPSCLVYRHWSSCRRHCSQWVCPRRNWPPLQALYPCCRAVAPRSPLHILMQRCLSSNWRWTAWRNNLYDSMLRSQHFITWQRSGLWRNHGFLMLCDL